MSDIDISTLLDKLRRCEYLRETEVLSLCRVARDLLAAESNIICLTPPITVAGDLHGQLWDLLELFRVAGCPHPELSGAHVERNDGLQSDTSALSPKAPTFLFLGDYVDRGLFSVETFCLLLCLKVKYPTKIYLLRGNHEARAITQVYGFYDETLRKYGGVTVWRFLTETMDFLSLGAEIQYVGGGGDGAFAVHGGLSPSIDTIDDIRRLQRLQEVPHEGAMSDLLWSDPDNADGWGVSPRGAGFLFGDKVVREFLHKNEVGLILRAHQLAMEGYKWWFGSSLVTIWSAPNYVYRCGNSAAVCELAEDGEREFKRFYAAPPGKRGVPMRKPLPEYFL